MPRSFTNWLKDRIEDATAEKNCPLHDAATKAYEKGRADGFKQALEAFESWSKNKLEDE